METEDLFDDCLKILGVGDVGLLDELVFADDVVKLDRVGCG